MDGSQYHEQNSYQLCFPFLDKETSRAFLSAKSLEVKWKVYGIPVYLHLCAFEHAKAGKNMKKCCIKREAKHQFSTPLLPPSSPSHPLCDIPGLSALAFGKGGGSSSKKDLPGGDTYHAIASCTISVTSGQDVRTDKTSMLLWYFCEKFALHCRIWLKHSHLRRSLCWCGFWNLQWKKSGNRPWNKFSCIRLHKCKYFYWMRTWDHHGDDWIMRWSLGFFLQWQWLESSVFHILSAVDTSFIKQLIQPLLALHFLLFTQHIQNIHTPHVCMSG